MTFRFDNETDLVIPSHAPRVAPNTAWDWNFTSMSLSLALVAKQPTIVLCAATPQAALKNRTVPVTRGHVLGGSSSISTLFSFGGEIEPSSGAQTIWVIREVQQMIMIGMLPSQRTTVGLGRECCLTSPRWVYRRGTSIHDAHNSPSDCTSQNENFTPPSDGNVTKLDPSVHSFTGVNTVSLPAFPRSDIENRILQASQESEEFSFNRDMNSGNHLGFGALVYPPSRTLRCLTNMLGWVQATINHGQRSSSAASYLGPGFVERPNLSVLINTRATRLTQTSAGNMSRTFDAVEITQDGGGELLLCLVWYRKHC